MTRNRTAAGAVRAITATALLAVLTAGCTHSAGRSDGSPATGGSPDAPGNANAQGPGINLTVTDAVAHLDAAGNGTLTMTVHNDDGVPEHLAMVGTPDAGRGTLVAGKGDGDGSLSNAGILLTAGSTVAFGAGGKGGGPSVRLTAVHGVTSAHTLPLVMEFGVARLIRVSARVTPN